MVRHLPGNPVNRERHAGAAKRFEGTSTTRWTLPFQIWSYLSDKAVGTGVARKRLQGRMYP